MSGYHARLDGARWLQTRRRALDRCGWRCSQCGRSGALEVHHVEPLHRGGAPYDLENLLVLCRSCHIAAHRRPVTAAEQAWRDLVAELR